MHVTCLATGEVQGLVLGLGKRIKFNAFITARSIAPSYSWNNYKCSMKVIKENAVHNVLNLLNETTLKRHSYSGFCYEAVNAMLATNIPS